MGKLKGAALSGKWLKGLLGDMEHKGAGVCLPSKGSVAGSGADENHVVFLQKIGLPVQTEFLAAAQENAQLVFVLMPVIPVIHDLVGESRQSQAL